MWVLALGMRSKRSSAPEKQGVTRGSLLLFSSGTAQGIIDDPLQLAVDAAEFIGGPSLEGIHRLRIYAQHKVPGPFLSHFSYTAIRR